VANKGHHKAADTLSGRNWLIRLFYGCYPFFAYCCVCTEFFYICLYLLHFNKGAVLVEVGGVAVTLWHVTFCVCAPACACKQAVNVAQLCAAAYSMAESDVAAKKKA
jgi:CDP-diacylglycerol--inositol 3-phosphatidyltransferase